MGHGALRLRLRQIPFLQRLDRRAKRQDWAESPSIQASSLPFHLGLFNLLGRPLTSLILPFPSFITKQYLGWNEIAEEWSSPDQDRPIKSPATPRHRRRAAKTFGASETTSSLTKIQNRQIVCQKLKWINYLMNDKFVFSLLFKKIRW